MKQRRGHAIVKKKTCRKGNTHDVLHDFFRFPTRIDKRGEGKGVYKELH